MMRRISALVVILLLGGGLFMFFSSSQDQDMPTQQSSQEQATTYDVITTEVSSGDAVLLDVRTPAEYQEGYVAPAENYPLQLLTQDQLPDIPKDTTIYLYCRTGNRSAQAATILHQAGYEDVVDLGGLPDMIAIGGEVLRD